MTKATDINSGLTADILRSLVHYDRSTGKFHWRVSSNANIIGDEAGTVEPATGYVRFTVLGRKYQAHRLAWLYVTGGWPSGQLDHRDLMKSNNAFDNLRQATSGGNSANRRALKNNVLGVKGVMEIAPGRFRARIWANGRNKSLGVFRSAEAASSAYAKEADIIFGQFARAA